MFNHKSCKFSELLIRMTFSRMCLGLNLKVPNESESYGQALLTCIRNA